MYDARRLFVRFKEKTIAVLKNSLSNSTLLLALTLLAALAAVLGVALRVRERHEESATIVSRLEARLLFHSPDDVFSREEIHSLKELIDSAYEKNHNSAKLWAFGGIYQALLSSIDNRYRGGSISACQRSMELDSLDPLSNLCSGIASFINNDMGEAEQRLTYVVQQEPRWDIAWYQLARTLMRSGKFKEAKHAFMMAKAVSPNTAAYSIGLASTQALLECDVTGAVETLAAAVSAKPESAALHNSLGVILYYGDQTAAAVEQFRMAHALDPDNYDFAINLATLLNENNTPTEALRYAQAAHGLGLQGRDAVAELVFSLVALKKYRVALKYSTKLKEIAGDFSWVNSNHDYIIQYALGETIRDTLNVNGTTLFLHPPARIQFLESSRLSRFDERLKKPLFAVEGTRLVARFEERFACGSGSVGEWKGGNNNIGTSSTTLVYCAGGCSEPLLDEEWLGLVMAEDQ